MRKYIAGKNEDGARLSRFVQSVTTGLPVSLLYKSFRNKRIKVNGKKGAPDTRLCAGDVVELYLNDEFFPPAAPPQAPPARKKRPPLRVVYEDENIAALYKPAHLLCHPDRTGDASLVELFLERLVASGSYDPSAEASFTPALCNRLDRGTEGLVLAAKNYAALRGLNEAIRRGLVQKEYCCITAGVPPRGRHTAWLRHAEKGNRAEVRADEAPGYKEIITEVDILRTKGPLALCRIGLITGRTHQIRAHLSFLGAPVLGDVKYGNRRWNERCGCKTQALCAVRVRFGEFPAGSALSYLSGRTIEVEKPQVFQAFEALAP